jgi:DNA-binding response OmpR family regulator
MSSCVLIVEDDSALRELLAFHLQQAGYRTLEAATAAEAWPLADEADVIILDRMLPDESGITWLQRLREHTLNDRKPVLMLTARASEMDKVSGLEAGADDYLVEPFSAAELKARLRALLRRIRPAGLVRLGDLVIDDEAGSATLAGVQLQLTRREFELLSFLAFNAGRTWSRPELLDRVWGQEFVGTERTVDQHIAQLRAVIGPQQIQTVRGRGYRLVKTG